MVPMVLAAIALLERAPLLGTIRFDTSRQKLLAWLIGAFVAVQSVGLVAILLTGGFITSVLGITVRANNPSRLLAGIAIGGAVLLALSADLRKIGRGAARSPLMLAVMLMLFSVWMSLGPLPQVKGQTLPAFGLYGWFYQHVPGFDGLRVPARYAMVGAVFLSIVAGYGAAGLLRRVQRPAVMATAIAAVFLIEAAFAPMPLNQTWGDGPIVPPARIESADRAPAVYKALAALPRSRVITEFPFGDPAWELR
jgi:hypothetical protein